MVREAPSALRRSSSVLLAISLVLSGLVAVSAESPYRIYDWTVTYGDIYPLGVRQQGILINGQFPGPSINCQTDDNIVVNVRNNLPEPFLLSWNGVQMRRNSWEDGVYGTNCPIPPGQNFTYQFQVKDQIGSFFYFPSLAFHKAAGAFGGIRILSRPLIPVPFPEPAGDFTVLIGDWYMKQHTVLKAVLDGGRRLAFPDGILINGRGPTNGASFPVQKGNTYRFRISNVGLEHSLNFRIQGHNMKLVEVEGTHTVQTTYSSIDIHVGQSYSVLVTMDQPAQDYYIAVSTRFTSKVLTSTAVLHYENSARPVSGPIPVGPTDIASSINQARSIRTNLTASGPRPNPQGSYHYGQITVTRTIMLVSSAAIVGQNQRYGVNGVSFIPAVENTPLKLADALGISGIFHVGSIPDSPTGRGLVLDTAVMAGEYRSFMEIVFENHEDIVQSWHIDGYNFWVVGMNSGRWNPARRGEYNLVDAVSRCTTQVYPRSWTAIYISVDNVGMWNVRTEFWARQYLGQQFYLRVFSPAMSTRDELLMPSNYLRCGKAAP